MPSDIKITVGVVEDQAATRDNLSGLIAAEDGFELVFAASTVADARAALDVRYPHALLIDLHLPDGDGMEILSHLQVAEAPTVVLVLSALSDEQNVIRAIRAGAMGYLLKNDNESVITVSIRQLLSGGSPISPSIARHLIHRFRSPRDVSDGRQGLPERLTPRELDVLTFAGKGYSYQEVADLLGVKPSTVSSYTKRIYEKLAVNSRSEALFEATRLGLVAPPTRE